MKLYSYLQKDILVKAFQLSYGRKRQNKLNVRHTYDNNKIAAGI